MWLTFASLEKVTTDSNLIRGILHQLSLIISISSPHFIVQIRIKFNSFEHRWCWSSRSFFFTSDNFSLLNPSNSAWQQIVTGWDLLYYYYYYFVANVLLFLCCLNSSLLPIFRCVPTQFRSKTFEWQKIRIVCWSKQTVPCGAVFRVEKCSKYCVCLWQISSFVNLMR